MWRSPSVRDGDTRLIPWTTARCLPDRWRVTSATDRAYGVSGVESSTARMPSSRRARGSASVRRMSGSGPGRVGRRVNASRAGGRGPSGRTRAASVAVYAFGVAMRKSMDSSASTCGAFMAER